MRLLSSIRRASRPYRSGIALALAFAVSLGGMWIAVSTTTRSLLHHDAADSAEKWALLLAESVPDLERIAEGEKPSATSIAFFGWAQAAGAVFRYKIFNLAGYSQLVAENGLILDSVSVFDDEPALALKTGEPIIHDEHDGSPGQPDFYAEAYVPIYVDGRPIAVVEAYVDQSHKAAEFQGAFLNAAIAITGLTALSFGLPAFTLYRRTRQKLLADERIRFLAHHDALTGLLNRNSLTVELNRSIASVGPRGSGLAVHFIDVDRLKEINDSRGHACGDFVLETVAERLRLVVRKGGGSVARLGGDEFVVVQLNADSRSEALGLAERIGAALTRPVHFEGREVPTSASIGVARAPADGMDAERLLACADLAMYRAKADQRGRIRLFEPEMDAELQERLGLEKAVRNAVADDRLELHYQPIFELSGRQLSGFEALVRMRADDGTLVLPSVFIPVAERLHLIDKIGEWVLREACRTAAKWPNHLSIAVNLSPAQFALGSVSDTVADTLTSSGLEPHRLELEVTESFADRRAPFGRLGVIQAQGNGCRHRDGRLWNRLLQPQLPFAVPVQQDQDRSKLHAQPRQDRPRYRNRRETDRRARPATRNEGDR
jgi:diguanylate cyclase (GGDEF)-like protein